MSFSFDPGYSVPTLTTSNLGWNHQYYYNTTLLTTTSGQIGAYIPTTDYTGSYNPGIYLINFNLCMYLNANGHDNPTETINITLYINNIDLGSFDYQVRYPSYNNTNKNNIAIVTPYFINIVKTWTNYVSGQSSLVFNIVWNGSNSAGNPYVQQYTYDSSIQRIG